VVLEINLGRVRSTAIAKKLDRTAAMSMMGSMNAAERIAPTITEPLSWAGICKRHPDKWVCLVEVEHEADGAIQSARVVGYHRSSKDALKQVDSWSVDPAVVCAHTGGRKLRFPRIEMTDEIRDLVRARR
jgi:hypothetical protein